MKLGRKFIGCEISGEYFETAERRISQAAQQPALFPARNPTKRAADVGDSVALPVFSIPEG
jgi:DNA modification methylase